MATVLQRLTEAEAAYHALQTGQAVVQITDQNGESVRYSQANSSRLAIYIRELKAELNGTPRTSGPIRPVFLL